MTKSLEEKIFLTTIGVVVSVDLLDVPVFKGLMVEKGLAHIGQNGNFKPNNQFDLVIVDPHSTPRSVTIFTSGMQIENPTVLERYVHGNTPKQL
jgi:hypothetical protein